MTEHYYVEDHEDGPLRANGKGGYPRTDKQPLVVAHSLTSADHDASEDGTGLGIAIPSVGVRRLTPGECEALQALPRDWTNPDGKAPDSRRYSALGDAVTASVAHWIGSRIADAIAESRQTTGGVT